MIRVVLLDSGPLGLLCNSRGGAASTDCNRWLNQIQQYGVKVVISAIADFEVRRELVLAGLMPSVVRLDRLMNLCIYMPVTQEVVAKASELWSDARRGGQPTADPLALDADVLIAAQAQCLEDAGFKVIVATFNAVHIGRYVRALSWTEIKAEEI